MLPDTWKYTSIIFKVKFNTQTHNIPTIYESHSALLRLWQLSPRTHQQIKNLSYINTSNYIKRLCVFVSLSVCMSRSLLSCIKSVWKAGGIVRTLSARTCYIPSFKKFHARVHAISHNFHAIWAISAIFGPISTCWVSKSMYSSQEIHW